MKAVVFYGIGDIRVTDQPDPAIQHRTDAIVKLTGSAICGTDLHMVRGTMPGMEPGTILGHEGVGVIEELGPDVKNFHVGDRVVIPSTIACGYCSYCRAGYQGQCDHANPNGPRVGAAFYGGPKMNGSFSGLQAEKARIPFANVGLMKVPDEVSDDQAILLSDIFPTGYFGAELAEIKDGDTVVVFGCGPVGQFAITSAILRGAGRVLAVDHVPSRLDMARAQGAEVINYDEEEPVQGILQLTGGIGPDRAIDAVGVDAGHPHHGPAVQQSDQVKTQFEQEVAQITQEGTSRGEYWRPGEAPTQALVWAVESLAKAGTLAIIGVYPQTARSFPIGEAMNKNLTMKMGICPHRKYLPHLIELVRRKSVDPLGILTRQEPLTAAVEAYQKFDKQQAGWMKVKLDPGQKAA